MKAGLGMAAGATGAFVGTPAEVILWSFNGTLKNEILEYVIGKNFNIIINLEHIIISRYENKM